MGLDSTLTIVSIAVALVTALIAAWMGVRGAWRIRDREEAAEAVGRNAAFERRIGFLEGGSRHDRDGGSSISPVAFGEMRGKVSEMQTDLTDMRAEMRLNFREFADALRDNRVNAQKEHQNVLNVQSTQQTQLTTITHDIKSLRTTIATLAKTIRNRTRNPQ